MIILLMVLALICGFLCAIYKEHKEYKEKRSSLLFLSKEEIEEGWNKL